MWNRTVTLKACLNLEAGVEIKETVPISIKAPAMIGKHISFRSTCELTELEIKYFELAFRLMRQYAENGHPIREDIRVNIAVIDKDEIVFYNPADKSLGCHMNWVFYYIHRIRQKPKAHEAHYMAMILEELCHALYLITNETEVKKTVLEIVNQMEGVHIEFDDWYQGENPPHLMPFLPRQRLFIEGT